MNVFPVGMNMPIDHVDVNEPKVHRPPNAFLLYIQTIRQDVREKNPSLTNLELSQLLGSMWKSAPDEVRKKFKEEAARLQQEFKEQHPEYCYRKTKRNKLASQKKQELMKPVPAANASFMYQQMFQMQQLQQMQMYQQMQQSYQMEPAPQPVAPARERQPRAKKKPAPEPEKEDAGAVDSAAASVMASLTADIWDDESIY